MDYYKESLSLHEKHRGKIEIRSKVPVNTRNDLSLAYTPGVAEPCRQIQKNPEDIYKYTNKGNLLAIITDGSAVLGLGNIGPEASLPVMEGKSVLFKEFAGIDVVPICLATQDTEEIIRTIKNIAPGFGGIILEDISAPRCFEIEQRLIEMLKIPVFHDDQHGTAIVVLAGLINSFKLTNRTFENTKIIMSGVGAAGSAIAKLLITYGVKPKNMILCDSKGVIFKGRASLNSIKEKLAQITNTACCISHDHPGCRTGNLEKAIEGADVFIGVSKPNLLTHELIKKMADSPIIFALSNPEPEIMPDIAKKAGAAIVATGRSDFPNQVNNVLAFPGLFRGILDNRIIKITDKIKITTAKAIANHIKNPSAEKILPDPLDKNISTKIAESIKKLQ